MTEFFSEPDKKITCPQIRMANPPPPPWNPPESSRNRDFSDSMGGGRDGGGGGGGGGGSATDVRRYSEGLRRVAEDLPLIAELG